MDASKFRSMSDAIYGYVALDEFLASLISQPEIQRLRDVRLSNINSQLLPGCANISRFEHSVGTAILAERTANSLGLGQSDRSLLVCAALLHDVAITPFGHLMEEGFDAAGTPFDHESRLQQIFMENAELGNVDRQIFRGRAAGFPAIFQRQPYRSYGIRPSDVFELMSGQGILGRLIKGSIDLDNIDNVCRMAHHIGIPFRRDLPTDIVTGFVLLNQKLCYDVDNIGALKEWLDLRRRLYSALMTNPIDFSAKAMLIEAIRLAIVGTDSAPPVIDETNWSFTDGDLWSVLRSFPPSSDLLTRLELGDYFDQMTLCWIDDILTSEHLQSRERSNAIREQLAQLLKLRPTEVLVYWIKDKRNRRIEDLPIRDRSAPTQEIDQFMGENSNSVLFGVFVGRKSSITRKNQENCVAYLSNLFQTTRIAQCDSHKHLADAFESNLEKSVSQLELF